MFHCQGMELLLEVKRQRGLRRSKNSTSVNLTKGGVGTPDSQFTSRNKEEKSAELMVSGKVQDQSPRSPPA